MSVSNNTITSSQSTLNLTITGDQVGLDSSILTVGSTGGFPGSNPKPPFYFTFGNQLSDRSIFVVPYKIAVDLRNIIGAVASYVKDFLPQVPTQKVSGFNPNNWRLLKEWGILSAVPPQNPIIAFPALSGGKASEAGAGKDLEFDSHQSYDAFRQLDVVINQLSEIRANPVSVPQKTINEIYMRLMALLNLLPLEQVQKIVASTLPDVQMCHSFLRHISEPNPDDLIAKNLHYVLGIRLGYYSFVQAFLEKFKGRIKLTDNELDNDQFKAALGALFQSEERAAGDESILLNLYEIVLKQKNYRAFKMIVELCIEKKKWGLVNKQLNAALLEEDKRAMAAILLLSIKEKELFFSEQIVSKIALHAIEAAENEPSEEKLNFNLLQALHIKCKDELMKMRFDIGDGQSLSLLTKAVLFGKGKIIDYLIRNDPEGKFFPKTFIEYQNLELLLGFYADLTEEKTKEISDKLIKHFRGSKP